MCVRVLLVRSFVNNIPTDIRGLSFARTPQMVRIVAARIAVAFGLMFAGHAAPVAEPELSGSDDVCQRVLCWLWKNRKGQTCMAQEHPCHCIARGRERMHAPSQLTAVQIM